MLHFSVRKARECKILSYRRNLLTMKQHSMLTLCLLFFLFADQMFMKTIEALPNMTRSEDIFNIYWFFHLIEKILVFPSKNLLILFSTKNFPEFYGYTGQRFPGQEKPRHILSGKRNQFNCWQLNQYLFLIGQCVHNRDKTAPPSSTAIRIIVSEPKQDVMSSSDAIVSVATFSS